MAARVYEKESRKQWADFRKEHDEKILSGMGGQTQRCTRESLRNFERVTNPKRLSAITTAMVDDFVKRRRLEPGRNGRCVSPATINKDLRHLKAVLRIAHEWEYLARVPKGADAESASEAGPVHDDATLHQHGHPTGRSRRAAVRAGGLAEGRGPVKQL